MNNIICVRDDDTNFYTKYEELQEGYGRFWGNIPVTLATIPFVHGSEYKILEFEYPPEQKFQKLRSWEKSASVDELNRYHMLMPIGNNNELVLNLKSLINAGKVEIAQHGISHRYNDLGAEMFFDNIGMLMIRDGREYLEKVFDADVNVFIPPSNSIDIKCAQYIENSGMQILCSGSIKSRYSYDKYIAYLKHPQDIISSLRTWRKRNVIPIRKRQKIWITGSKAFGVNDDVDTYVKCIMEQLEHQHAASVATHYRLLSVLDDERHTYRNRFWSVLDKLSAIENVEFVLASDYIRRIKNR